ncbi:MAG TPA: peptide chain release factor 3 [Elusimicrobiota bacterium]|nr:peptide chain release factor 3 [Elusimicrobiota bacterium]
MADIRAEVARRRTFAIISHPDAGKTTLTEKLLLYGGAIQQAGSVTARKNQSASASDWMELERKRGISVSSTVLQFDYEGHRINLLDTPGHKDFSEDTYRVLTAVDAAVMVIDAGKGIEAQTLKLFEVCRLRGIPILTFMNKLDRETRDLLGLIDQIESTLQIHAFPVNWPMGVGERFRGVYDRTTKQAHMYERTVRGAYMAPVNTAGIDDPVVKDSLDADSYHHFVEQLDLLDAAGADFDKADALKGGTTPVFFGSAVNNFGVQLLLDALLKHAPAPGRRKSAGGVVEPERESFSGFVFKIQGNMDPKHRDRVAFARVCSGKFTRDLPVTHSRTGRTFRVANAHKIFGRDREIIEEAYAGDVIGLVGYSELGIGDTLSEDPKVVYDEIPRFAPECFARFSNPNPAKYKPFAKGLEQMLREGVVRALTPFEAVGDAKTSLLAAVGPLQFEVAQFRMQSEYGVESRLEPMPWTLARWIGPKTPPGAVEAAGLPMQSARVRDEDGAEMILFPTPWSAQYLSEKHPEIELLRLPPARR